MKLHSHHSWYRSLISYSLAGSVLFAATTGSIGCGRPRSAKVNFFAAIDISNKNEQLLTDYGTILYRLQRQLSPSERLSVTVFSDRVLPIYDGHRIAGRIRFNEKIGHEILLQAGRENKPGTHTEQVLEYLADAAERSEEPVAVLLETDGGIEDVGPTALASIRSSIFRLSHCSQLQTFAIVGVLPEHRGHWNEWLSPLGSHVQIHGQRDADDLAAEMFVDALGERR